VESIVSQGVSLMIFGMGFVFVFLTLLVGATRVMSKLAAKFAPAPAPKPAPRAAAPAAPTQQNNDQLLAVMTAAIHQFRSKDGR